MSIRKIRKKRPNGDSKYAYKDVQKVTAEGCDEVSNE